MLLDPFEEQLDLPPASIEFGDREGRQREVVGEKDQRLVGLGILEPNASQRRVEAFVGIEAHAIIGVNVVSIGSLSFSIVHPREVFKPAILLNSAAIICSHNHPSGDPAPSSEDRVFTARLRQAGDLIGITILDHLILGDERSYSFADQGWPE
jgi:DNA repair protein RadC